MEGTDTGTVEVEPVGQYNPYKGYSIMMSLTRDCCFCHPE